MLRRRVSPSDDGSIILAMIAVLAVSGLLLAVLGTVLGSQRNTRFDRSFEQALQVAEAGLNEMSSLIQSNPVGTAVDFPPISVTMSDGSTYSTTATKTGVVWVVTSQGTTADGRSRTVQQELVVRPLFGLAAFGKLLVDFNGGNGSDSFDSAYGTDICFDNGNTQPLVTNYIDPGVPTNALTSNTNVRMCRRTGLGTVATNKELLLKGGVAAKIDRAEVHNAKEHVVDPLPDATGFCSGVPETCALRTTNPQRLFFYREPIELPPITACDGATGTPKRFGFTDADSVKFPLGGQTYLFSDALLDGSTQFSGTMASPTILCVTGKLTIQNQHLINFELKNGRMVPRRPGTLLIFVLGTSNSGVTMGNNASISAAIYSPHAAVYCGPQGNVYGSLIANTIDNAGGWNFHYDDALGALGLNAPVRRQNWQETYASGQ